MLAHIVAGRLQLQWSPEQIAGWLKRTYPDDKSCQVSHETIYRSLFIQARGVLKKELLEHLRRTRAMRRSRHHTQKTDTITAGFSIRSRSVSGQPRLKIERYPVTGKAICCVAIGAARLRLSSSVIVAMSCW